MAREHLHQPGDDRVQQRVQFVVAGRPGCDEHRHAMGAAPQGRLYVGISGSLLYREVATIMSRFQTELPMVDLVLQEFSTSEQLDKLLRGQLDAGFLQGSKVPPPLKSMPLENDVFVVCLHERHPLAGRDAVDLRELSEERFVMFSREAAPSNHDNVIAIFSNAGVHPRTVHMARTWLTIISLVAQVNGVALVPRSLQKARMAGVRFVPLKMTSAPAPAMLAWNPDTASGELAKFLETAARVLGARR